MNVHTEKCNFSLPLELRHHASNLLRFGTIKISENFVVWFRSFSSLSWGGGRIRFRKKSSPVPMEDLFMECLFCCSNEIFNEKVSRLEAWRIWTTMRKESKKRRRKSNRICSTFFFYPSRPLIYPFSESFDFESHVSLWAMLHAQELVPTLHNSRSGNNFKLESAKRERDEKSKKFSVVENN